MFNVLFISYLTRPFPILSRPSSMQGVSGFPNVDRNFLEANLEFIIVAYQIAFRLKSSDKISQTFLLQRLFRQAIGPNVTGDFVRWPPWIIGLAKCPRDTIIIRSRETGPAIIARAKPFKSRFNPRTVKHFRCKSSAFPSPATFL